MEILGRTSTGKVRENNEDTFAIDADSGVAVLADGMGGLDAGEIASRIAVSSVLQSLRANSDLSERGMVSAIEMANQAVFSQATTHNEGNAMGTTLVIWANAAYGQCYVGHVGDSRAYRIRAASLHPLTSDHSLVQQLVDEGVMSEIEARIAPNRNVITRAVGLEPEVQADVRSWVHARGDVFLLCSDGLTDMLTTGEISACVAEHLSAEGQGSLADTADELIAAANFAGGYDNVSVVLIRPDTTAL